MLGRCWFVSLSLAMFYVLFAVSDGIGKEIYVDAGAGLGGDGTSWETAYRCLQDALHEPPSGGLDSSARFEHQRRVWQ